MVKIIAHVRIWRSRYRTALICGAMAVISVATAQEPHDSEVEKLKQLPIEQLIDIEITSVSRRPEPLLKAASAIDVITHEDIRRAGTTNIPDTLRLATGLHVAQVDGHTWAISARGFNTATANKMQVLLDGRNLYTPLFSGVFWDVQHTFLPDIEQIEVISGPGATLWGANAVNGVINIRSKSAKDTQGWLMQGGGGGFERGFGGIRYGGKSGNTYYRAYVTTLNRDNLTTEAFGLDARDEYSLTQGGFRIDSDLTDSDLLTLQGDLYSGRFGQFIGNDVEVRGGNLLGRWTHEVSATESYFLQAYYDRTHRFIPGLGQEVRNSFDLEWQHSFALTGRQNVIWGLNARVSEDDLGRFGTGLAFLPDHQTSYLFSGFIQDEIQVLPDFLVLTLGSKLEWNSFSGFEVQPSARFAWTPTEKQTVWGAVSRAVRTPTRIDQDLFIPNPAVVPPGILQSSRTFDSEVLIAYELGYRNQWRPDFTTDLTLFYHDYDNVRSQEPLGAGPFPVTFANLMEGESYGGTIDVKWQPARWWQMNLGYTLMDMRLRAKPGSRDLTGGVSEGNDPNNILVFRSWFDLPANLEFDATFRYVDSLPSPATPAYSTVDLRLAWHPRKDVELAILGRNLLDESHPEFRTATSREVGRSIYFMFTWQY
ncbi:MAG TPA: TonB-dependent receptor [Prosthecobacter sp.]|nr:TonB-dependent receptor [Prosthecobacter sp.]